MPETPTLEQTLAPAVEPAWASRFIIAARAEGVRGDAIADALVEVNDDVATSGETAEIRFGPAEAYEASLGLPRERITPAEAVALVAPSGIGVLGITAVLSCVQPLRDGGPAHLSLGQVIGTGMILAAIAAIAFWGSAVARGVVRRPWVFVSLGWVWFMACLACVNLLRQPIATVAAWPVLLAGFGLLGLSSLLYWRQPSMADPITPPLGRADRPPPPRRRPAGQVGLVWLFPLGTLAVGVLLWFVMP